MKDVSVAYIAVGSNLGDRAQYIAQARHAVEQDRHIQSFIASSIIETGPIGGPVQGKYLNAVWRVETDYAAHDLLVRLLQIEVSLGRKRTVRNGPRTIDLDILFFDDAIICEDDLVVPHARLHERAFILQLLEEINPHLVHPVFNKTVIQLREDVSDEQS